MDITATLINIFPLQTGKGKNGIWKKQELLFEMEGQYSKKLFASTWGDLVDPLSLHEGQKYNLFFDVESREYNGRWYTDAKIWKLEPVTEGATTQTPDSPPLPDANQDDLGYDPMDPLPF